MITREDLVSQSVMDHAVGGIAARGYPPTTVAFLESFPYSVSGPLQKNLIAAGFDFDDGGEQAELGSALKRRLYTIEFFVFGMTATYARNLAHALKFVLEGDGRIPLKDIGQPGAPIIDYLTVEAVSAQRQIIADPDPFQEFVYTTTLRVHDEYYAAIA
jgi:hypothetical protein